MTDPIRAGVCASGASCVQRQKNDERPGVGKRPSTRAAHYGLPAVPANRAPPQCLLSAADGHVLRCERGVLGVNPFGGCTGKTSLRFIFIAGAIIASQLVHGRADSEYLVTRSAIANAIPTRGRIAPAGWVPTVKRGSPMHRPGKGLST